MNLSVFIIIISILLPFLLITIISHFGKTLIKCPYCGITKKGRFNVKYKCKNCGHKFISKHGNSNYINGINSQGIQLALGLFLIIWSILSYAFKFNYLGDFRSLYAFLLGIIVMIISIYQNKKQK